MFPAIFSDQSGRIDTCSSNESKREPYLLLVGAGGVPCRHSIGLPVFLKAERQPPIHSAAGVRGAVVIGQPETGAAAAAATCTHDRETSPVRSARL